MTTPVFIIIQYLAEVCLCFVIVLVLLSVSVHYIMLFLLLHTIIQA